MTFLMPSARAQISFATAVDLALRNSPRIQAAQDDVRKAQATVAESKDLYIPGVAMAGGAGYSYGITLSVPTIFTVNAQSLVYNASQRSYILGARLNLQAVTARLEDVREQVEEDAASTYFDLQHAEDALTTVAEIDVAANRLLAIVEDRAKVGFETPLDIKRARLTTLRIKLNRLRAEDELASARERLGQLIGVGSPGLATVPQSIPSHEDFDRAAASAEGARRDSAAVLSAQAIQQSLQMKAHGDARHLWRPQINSFAQYGRVSPINDVSDFYNLHGEYNTYSAGFQVQFPLLDQVQKRHAEESVADASRAEHEVQLLRFDQNLDRLNLKHSLEELQSSFAIASLSYDIAQDETKEVSARLQGGGGGGPPLTPKEEASARIAELQRYLDLLGIDRQLRQASVRLLRQSGGLESWLQTISTPSTQATLPTF